MCIVSNEKLISSFDDLCCMQNFDQEFSNLSYQNTCQAYIIAAFDSLQGL
jgi:hypothetical protein